MKKIFKALAVTGVALSATAGLASCNKGAEEKVSIVIGVQQTSGNNYESMCNFLDDLKGELNFDYETVLLESRNNDKNLSTFQTKMLAGAQGIISMVDMDKANLSKLLADCEKNDVYYAGYMSDFANVNKDETIMNNKYMLGTVSDGEIDGAVRGEFLFNQVVKSTDRKIVFSRFPVYAYPSAVASINKFKELADAYNATHDDDFTYYTNNDGSDTYEFGFTTPTLPDAEAQAWKNANVDAVVAVNSLGKRLLPAFKSNNMDTTTNIYTLGWEDNIISDFGDDKCVKTLGQTPAETIVYPLVRILNAARGKSYSDEPSMNDKVVTGRYTYLASTADLNNGRINSMNFSTDHSVSHAIISKAEVKALLAGEKDATYKKLVDTLNSWDSQYALTRKH